MFARALAAATSALLSRVSLFFSPSHPSDALFAPTWRAVILRQLDFLACMRMFCAPTASPRHTRARRQRIKGRLRTGAPKFPTKRSRTRPRRPR
jgi:hypothetical protein